MARPALEHWVLSASPKTTLLRPSAVGEDEVGSDLESLREI